MDIVLLLKGHNWQQSFFVPMRISSIMDDPADTYFIPDSISLYILCLLWTSISEIMMPLHGCCRSKVGDDAAWRKAAAYIFENSCCSTRDENWLYHTWNPNSLMNKVDIKRGARSNSFLFIVTCFDFSKMKVECLRHRVAIHFILNCHWNIQNWKCIGCMNHHFFLLLL